MKYDFNIFCQILDDWKIEYTNEQLNQFARFYEMMIERNNILNLTTITEFDEVISKHFLDSIALCKYLNLNQSVSLLDLGSGAGFPGIPLKIMNPDLSITLVDSLNKRIHFMNDVIEELELDSINAVHARAEELAVDVHYREQFDYCVSRAVANLSTLSEYCLPFVSVGGCFISYKSGEIEEELEAAKHAIFVLGGSVKEVIPFQLDHTDFHRSLIFIDKTKKTPKAYPRKAGTPKRNPIV